MNEQTAKRPHDVFISYASENKAVADAIVADFEQNSIRCWYAPRDIRAGTNYMDALVGAIKDAEAVVLVYSEESNESKFVLNEISIAFNEGKTIVPFRLADIQMGNALSFCLNNVHWMDATIPPLRRNISTLREHISSIIPYNKEKTEIKNPVIEPNPIEKESNKSGIWWVRIVAAVMAVALIVWLAGRTVGFFPIILAHFSRLSNSPMELADTWEEIIEAAHCGTYKIKYRIGDTKEIAIGLESITMKLVAMDEDDLADGSGKAPMTWVADELLQSEHNMNLSDTNKGGWEESEMRSWLRKEILPLMPEEVRNNIRDVKKYSYSFKGYKNGKADETTDTIWIPSVREIFLADRSEWVNKYYEKEGAAYTEVFKGYMSRIKAHAGASGASWWWLRSANYYFVYFFNGVNSDGSIDYDINADLTGGVAVGFCL